MNIQNYRGRHRRRVAFVLQETTFKFKVMKVFSVLFVQVTIRLIPRATCNELLISLNIEQIFPFSQITFNRYQECLIHSCPKMRIRCDNDFSDWVVVMWGTEIISISHLYGKGSLQSSSLCVLFFLHSKYQISRDFCVRLSIWLLSSVG